MVITTANGDRIDTEEVKRVRHDGAQGLTIQFFDRAGGDFREYSDPNGALFEAFEKAGFVAI
jgi:hypothetical protein